MTRLALRFGRFNLVGWMGALWQMGLLSLLSARLPLIVATLIAVELAVLHNFVWHECFTWDSRGVRSARQIALRLGRFQVSNGLISIAGNTLLMYGFVKRLQAHVAPSAMAAIVLCSFANFLLADRWVYRKRIAGQPAPPRLPNQDASES